MKSAKNAGFTLLEVMIAMAILAMSMTSLLSSQAASLRATRYAQSITSMAFLAEYMLIEIEWRVREEGGWETQDKTYEGDFREQGWPDVNYKCVIDYIEIPDYTQLQQAKEDSERQANDGSLSEVKDSGDMAFSSLSMVWPMIKATIESSLRKVSCTVIRKDGELDQEYTLSTYWADPDQLQAQAANFGGEVTEDTQDSPTTPSGNGDGGQPGSTARPGGNRPGGSRPGFQLGPGGSR